MIEHDLYLCVRKWNRRATPVLVLEMDVEMALFIESCLPRSDGFTKDFAEFVTRLEAQTQEIEDAS
jgi:hypothetical protein